MLGGNPTFGERVLGPLAEMTLRWFVRKRHVVYAIELRQNDAGIVSESNLRGV